MEEKHIWKAISDEELLAEVRTRGLEVPSAVGATATQAAGVETNGLSEGQHEFLTKVGDYLNPEVEITAEAQLELMNHFWKSLGHNMPELSPLQRQMLEEKTSGADGWRIMPAPLVNLNERELIAERARTFPHNQLSQNRNALWTPGEEWLYGKLLRAPEKVVKEDGTRYALRYKTPNGEIVGRRGYIDAMKATGQIVEGEDGALWTFPVMDVQVQTERTNQPAKVLHEKVDPSVTPETLIATQLLHQAAGTPNDEWHVDFANEAIYELPKRRSEAKALLRVAGVDWRPDNRRVRLGYWRAGLRGGDFGVRGAESGL